MSFGSPWFLGFLGFIPLVILMYMLKQKFQEKEISSTFLWDAVIKDMEVNKPWQKLKNNLLLIIQLIIITLLVLAGANPLMNLKGKSTKNSIIVIDNSGSMNALYDKESRLDKGKKLAMELISSLPSNSKVTVISSSKFSKVELNSGSKAMAMEKIRSIAPTDCWGDINEAVSMVKSIGKELGEYRAYFYTDNQVNLKDINGDSISLTSKKDNVSLDYISHKIEENSLMALVRVNNRTNSKITREISLFSGEKLASIQKVELEPREIKTVYFKNIPLKEAYIYAKISEKDGLDRDNVIYHVIKQPKINKILLISKGNLFIEKALSHFNNVELYKTESPATLKDKYDLYIFDGETPPKLPPEGNLMFINPSTNGLFTVGKEVKGGEAEVRNTALTKYMDNAYFVVSKMKDIKLPHWAEEIFKIDDHTGGFVGDISGRKVGVLAFSMQNSDFPLTLEFPVFINNMVEYFFQGNLSYKTSYISGDEIAINPLPDAKSIYINTPLGIRENISPEYPVKPYSDTIKSGIYTIEEKSTSGKVRKSAVAVNFPVQKESDIKKEVKSLSNGENASSVNRNIVSLQNMLILLAILFLVFEWIYYTRNSRRTL